MASCPLNSPSSNITRILLLDGSSSRMLTLVPTGKARSNGAVILSPVFARNVTLISRAHGTASLAEGNCIPRPAATPKPRVSCL